ncbi:MAG: hypothetical protein V1740_01770 [Candidatus Woesearchaeota archaeon]
MKRGDIFSRRTLLKAAVALAAGTNLNCPVNNQFIGYGSDSFTLPEIIDLNQSEAEVLDYFRQVFYIGLESLRFGDIHAHTIYSFLSGLCGLTDQTSIHGPDLALQLAKSRGLDFIALTENSEMQNIAAITNIAKNFGDQQVINKLREYYAQKLNPIEMLERLEHDFKEKSIGSVLGLSTWRSEIEWNALHNSLGIIAFNAFEYTNTVNLPIIGSSESFGHRVALFRDIEQDRVPWNPIGASWIASQIFQAEYAHTGRDLHSMLSGYEGRVMTIPHAVAKIGNTDNLNQSGGPQDHRLDLNYLNKRFDRGVEIFSKWGNFMGPAPHGYPGADQEVLFFYSRGIADPITIRSFLHQGWCVNGDDNFALGFFGGTDGHTGDPASPVYPSCMMYCPGSVTGVVARNSTRREVFDGMFDGHTIVTTTSASNKRIPMLMAVRTNGNDYLMGDQGVHDGHVVLNVVADRDVAQLELVVDGGVAGAYAGNHLCADISLAPGNHFVYARAVSFDIENKYTWTSPVYLRSPD